MITLLRKLVGITGRPRPTNLDAAMIKLAYNLRPDDSFCVQEDNWRYKDGMAPKLFRVTLFFGSNILVQKEGTVLNGVVDAALAEYRLKIS